MAPRRSVVLAVLALVLALAACGGGGPNRLPKEEYAAKVSKLCLRAAKQFREMHLVNTMEGWQQNANEMVRIRMRFNKGLGALKVPISIKTDAADLLVSYQSLLDSDEFVFAAARAGDRLGFFHALRAQRRDERGAHRAAQEMGAKGC